MEANELIRLASAIERKHNLSSRWAAVLTDWIRQCDGFIELMTLDEETTPVYLVGLLVQKIEQLDDRITDAAFIDFLSKNCDILFLRAQFGSQFWDSTKLSFHRFCRLAPETTPHQMIVDAAHTDAANVQAYLETRLV